MRMVGQLDALRMVGVVELGALLWLFDCCMFVFVRALEQPQASFCVRFCSQRDESTVKSLL